MPRRIVEQCSRADLSSIEYLASIIGDPKQLDVSTLTRTQKAAIRFLIITQARGIPWDLVKDTVKEVLFWANLDGTTMTHIEIKFLAKKESIERVKTFKVLWEK